MTDEALKPCPFCGGSVTIDDCGEGDLFVFLCQEGSSCIGSGFANYGLRSKKAKAITAWNTRADGDRIEALQAEVERLKDQLSVETEPSPYCPICFSCGDEGCCGSKRCMYPDTGTEALRAENAKLRASNQAAAECVAAMTEKCARYRDEIYAALQEAGETFTHPDNV